MVRRYYLVIAACAAAVGALALLPVTPAQGAARPPWSAPVPVARYALIRAEAPQARIALLTVFPGRSHRAAASRTDRAIVTAAEAADRQVIIMDPLVAGWTFAHVRGGLHPTCSSRWRPPSSSLRRRKPTKTARPWEAGASPPPWSRPMTRCSGTSGRLRGSRRTVAAA